MCLDDDSTQPSPPPATNIQFLLGHSLDHAAEAWNQLREGSDGNSPAVCVRAYYLGSSFGKSIQTIRPFLEAAMAFVFEVLLA